MDTRLAKKVLLIGWDAADWIIIDKLLKNHELPTLEKFINGGVRGNIATLEPPASPILWTSIATGMLPHKHGVLGFVEPNNETGGIRPIRSTARKVKAVWNILTQNDIQSNVVGWWPSNPVEPIKGTMISNLYPLTEGKIEDPWPLRPGTVYPERLAKKMEELRIHPKELTEQHLLPFIPNLLQLDFTKDKYASDLAVMLAEVATMHAAATWLMENEEWEFMAVYYDSIDHFSHLFMKFHPPKIVPELDDQLYENYKHVVTGIYKFHDMMLERTLALAGEDTTVIIMSDHGFYSDHLRPKYIPKEHSGPTIEHRPFGILCMNGPGIKAGETIYGSTLLDITPTILTLLGLPVGKDMDGKVLTAAFKENITPSFIESWEKVEGECGMHPADLQEDPWEAQAAMKQLIELGYIENPGEEKNKGAEHAVKEAQFNLVKSFLSIHNYEEAYAIIAKLQRENPSDIRFSKYLLTCLTKMGKHKEARVVINKIKASNTAFTDSLAMLEGRILVGEKRYNDAIAIFQKLYDTNLGNPNLCLELAHIYLLLDNVEQAIEAFDNTLRLDNENSIAYFGLGRCYLKTQNYPLAIDNLLRTTELIYHNPGAHYCLGEALALQGETNYAINAFNVAVAQSPGLMMAHQWLIKLYKEQHQMDKVKWHQDYVSMTLIKPNIIVSGLPRSGTSAMMQMLDLGGADILTDGLRTADDSNPKGYLEFEAVKNMAKNVEWLKDINGKTIKIISHLLQYMPPENTYKVIFMERDISEVLMSQQKMLGKSAKDGYPVMLGKTLTDQVAKIKLWLERQANIEVIYINYADLVNNPLAIAQEVAAFTEQGMDISKMTQAIDKKLYRNNKPLW
jgi:predicted AlkP superfamily phosphohydrolase/phosphomutase/tetratricopeptide (TPR) repeat protein